MHYILLVIVSTISLSTSGPINILQDSEKHMDEVVYVPFDIDYVPVNVPTSTENLYTEGKSFPEVGETKAKSSIQPILLDESTFKALENFKNIREDITEDTKVFPISTPKHPPEYVKDAADSAIELKHKTTEDKESSFDLFEEIFNHDPSKSSDDFVLVPISVIKKLQDDSKKLPLISTLNHSTEHVKDAADFNNESKHKSTEDTESSFDLFVEKFNHDPSKTSDDFVFGPISVISKLQDDSKKSDSSTHTHTIEKRQAPGNDFRVYRPVVQFRGVFRDRRRFNRLPAFVGYLNDYDHFPTVA